VKEPPTEPVPSNETTKPLPTSGTRPVSRYQRMRLMTANLLYKNGASAEALSETLDVVKPDILAVQELTEPISEAITDRFTHHFLTYRPDGAGTAIAADRPITLDVFPLRHRSGVVATLRPEHWPEFAGPVEILNVHLANPIERLPGAIVTLRRDQIEAVEERLATTPHRRVLCGDLNATPAWPAYRRLRHSYRDGVMEAATRQGKRPARTWAYSRRGPRLLRIDHVLVNDLHVEAAEALRVSGSDHFAVVVDLADAR
jgi:endonuclease/exonuclease/phosphatase (EEP) superfamily protein YafD